MAKVKEKIGETKQIIEENAVDAPVKDVVWNANQAEVESTTNLQDDTGHGGAAIIRSFTYGINPEAFKIHVPTKQELFNHHIKQIEITLYGDGLKIMTEVQPQIKFNRKMTQYTIIVGAQPMRGQTLLQTPQLLSDIIRT